MAQIDLKGVMSTFRYAWKRDINKLERNVAFSVAFYLNRYF